MGITIQENASYAPQIREVISKYSQVDNVIIQTGRNDDGTDPFPANRNEILIALKDYTLWRDDISKADLVKQITSYLEQEFPSVNFSAGQPIIDQVMEIITGSAADLAVSLVDDDLVLMRNKADSVAAIVRDMQGRIESNITIPKGSELIFGGQYENLERAGKQLALLYR